MTSSTVTPTTDTQATVALDLIDVGENVRPLDLLHVEALAGSIALRGLLVPVLLRPVGERFALVAGHHRIAACRSLGWESIPYTLREQEGSSADTAAENVMRKQLTPLEEALAVKNMLDEGYTLDGAAAALGWSAKLVSARAKILTLPEIAQQFIGSGALPVSSVGVLELITQVSVEVCEAAVSLVANGEVSGTELAQRPSRVLGYRLKGSKVFCCLLERADECDIGELRLGKKADALLEQATELHKKLNPHSYGHRRSGSPSRTSTRLVRPVC
jgi:ParB/RepB/Spo0J family partition protein